MPNPSAAILVIGDEILSGRTRDSNLHYLSCELTKIGINLQEARLVQDEAAEIVDAVGDKLDVICEGGIHRGTHMLKALSLGAKACSGGRLYLYALAAGGQAGVERAIEKYQAELVRDMKLMGCTKISDLNRNNLRFRR